MTRRPQAPGPASRALSDAETPRLLAPVEPNLGPATVRTTRLRVRYAETDRMGVVYYANYLVWFEVGRTEWLRQSGWTYREMERDGISLPVIEAHCEYRRSARYDDDVAIATRGHLVTPIRIRFDYEVARVADGTVAAVGHTVHTAIGVDGKPCRLPSRVRQMLA